MKTTIPETIYALSALSTEKESSAVLSKSTVLYFSDQNRLEQAVNEYKQAYSFLYDEHDGTKELYCLMVEEYRVNTLYPQKLSTRVYSPDGVLIEDCDIPDGAHFAGRKEEQLMHKVGDIVETPYGENLCLGIVVDRPPVQEREASYPMSASDDSYTLLLYPSMELDYAHTPLVFKPRHQVKEEIRCQLQEALAQYVVKD